AAQLRRGSSSADFVVVDTGPGDWKVLDEALKLADLAILPTAPSPIDLDRFWETEQIASQLTRTYALITHADRRTKSLKQTGDVHALVTSVHVTIQVTESMRVESKDAATLARNRNRLWVTEAIQPKMDDFGL